MSVKQLVDYIDEIKVREAKYVRREGSGCYAFLKLEIPTEMLIEYSESRGRGDILPSGEEFWKKSGLATRLRKSARHHPT